MRSFLYSKLEELDPDEIDARLKSGGIQALPRWPYEHDGWIITFYPIPKRPGLRGKGCVRPIGGLSYMDGFVDSSTPIRKAITAKAGRYGDLELPYVIAVNALDEASVDVIDIMNALFGEEKCIVSSGEDGGISGAGITRVPNGAWTSESGPRNTRVSAVLLAVLLYPWTVGSAVVRLIHNPWARRPYSSPLTCLPQGIPEDSAIKWLEGKSLHELLGLVPKWPVLSSE
jgi:hypothetical protein